MGEYADEAVQREIDRRPPPPPPLPPLPVPKPEMERRPIPAPPIPPAVPQPPGGTKEWAAYHLRYSLAPDDAAIVEWLATWPQRHQRLVEYAAACHIRKWAGWQAALAWECVEAMTLPLDAWDDDIPF